MAPRSIRFLTTEPDPVTGISITPFNIGGASAFSLVVAVSITVTDDTAYTGFSPHEQVGDTAVDTESGTI